MDRPLASPSLSSSPWVLINLILITLIGAGLRIYGIDRQSLWSDELFAVMTSYKPAFRDIWSLLTSDSHPPGYVSFMYFTIPWTGYSDFGIRLHALIFGTLWIPLVFWIGRRWFSDSVGLIAAALITSAYTAIYYSQEARAYSMLGTFSLINVIYFFEILFADKRTHLTWLGFWLSSSVILYLHYSGLVHIATEGLLYIILWLFDKSRYSLKELVKLFAPPLLLFTPWLHLMYRHMTDTSLNWAVSPIPQPIDIYQVGVRLLGYDLHQALFYMFGIFISLLILVFEIFKPGFTRKLKILFSLLFLAIIPILAFYIESQIYTPIFEKRYFINTLPLATLLVALSISYLFKLIPAKHFRYCTYLLTVLLLTIIAMQTYINIYNHKLYSGLQKDPFREAVKVIKQDLSDNNNSKAYTVLMTHDAFQHYLRKNNIHFESSKSFGRYYTPQQFNELEKYFYKTPSIETFYYLSLQQSHSGPAIFPLLQKYKLLFKETISVPSGAIDIYKFSVTESASEEQRSEVGSTPLNDIAELIATKTQNKMPETYTVLMTHDWFKPYLRQHQVAFQDEYSMLYADIQINSFVEYISSQPKQKTLYYIALREPNAEITKLLLESYYSLLNTHSIQTSIGFVDIFEFDIQKSGKITSQVKDALKGRTLNDMAEYIVKDNDNPKRYTVILTENFFQPYLHIHDVNIDLNWQGRFIYLPAQIADITDYLKAHSDVHTFYYLSRNNPEIDAVIDALQNHWPLLCKSQAGVSAIGSVQIMKFSVNHHGATDHSQPPPCIKTIINPSN